MDFHALGTVPPALAPALSLSEPRPYFLRAISSNQLFGLVKRQAGYAPSSVDCGVGATCAEACGPNFVQCPSNDGQLHCFDPSVKETCCTNGSGCTSSLFTAPTKGCHLLIEYQCPATTAITAQAIGLVVPGAALT